MSYVVIYCSCNHYVESNHSCYFSTALLCRCTITLWYINLFLFAFFPELLELISDRISSKRVQVVELEPYHTDNGMDTHRSIFIGGYCTQFIHNTSVRFPSLTILNSSLLFTDISNSLEVTL